ncbi:MAG: hypothetical protein DCF29_12425 [Alphaproteobacteria bacterium]|nr:MAG: hypothetical protein DCF29_12425 [Alphaproteobacteria bacterium]
MRSFILAAGLFFCAESAFAQAPTPASAFTEARTLCQADDETLWGVDLCSAPLLLVDPTTRKLYALRRGDSDALQPDGDLFTGVLPRDVNIANTAVDWDGVRWAMVMLPLPENPLCRRALLMHESWHGIQARLGLPLSSPTPEHLATAKGRALMRLEWRALTAALEAKDEDAAEQALADALAFRAARRATAGAGADEERQLEMNEGLAEYTGLRLSGGDAKAEAVRALSAAELTDSYVRSFAYASGPAYGLLLDQADPNWRRGLTQAEDLGALLAARAQIQPGNASLAEGRYGGADIRADESRRAEAARIVSAAWAAKLVDGPRLVLPFQSMQIAFNPNTVTALSPHGSVYPELRVVDAWGVLEVTDGALIDPNWSGAVVAAPTSIEGREGSGWTLQLNSGWSLEAGERPGDFRLVKR